MNVLAYGFIASSVTQSLTGNGCRFGVSTPIRFWRKFDGESASVRPVLYYAYAEAELTTCGALCDRRR